MPEGIEAELEVQGAPRRLPRPVVVEEGEEVAQPVLGRDGRAVDGAAQRRHLLLRTLLEQGQEEVVLALEVGVDGALGEPGGPGHLVERGAVEPVLGEDHGGGRQQAPARRLPPAGGGERQQRLDGGVDTVKYIGYRWVPTAAT